ncbi:MAG: hypothetical protein KIS78_18285 [Labilithrix sp.]|nr:hypothetical protein [Labilithrix sp.]
MSDPERLFDHGSPFERSLLRSSESEEPSRRLEEKVLAALAAAPAAGVDPAPAGDAAGDGARLLRPMMLATLAVGLLVGGGIALGPRLRPARRPPEITRRPPRRRRPRPLRRRRPRRRAPDVLIVRLDALPSAPPAARAAVVARATSTATTATLALRRRLRRSSARSRCSTR